MIRYKQKQYSEEYKSLFLAFLCQLEGWKCRCKNLHWSAPGKSIHVYLDEFLEVLEDYQDSLAEGYMGLFEQLDPNDLEGVLCGSTNALDFIEEVRDGVYKFYKRIPEGVEFKGITGETENFIQNVNKYHYLFSLCFSGRLMGREFSDKDERIKDTGAVGAATLGTIGLGSMDTGKLTW